LCAIQTEPADLAAQVTNVTTTSTNVHWISLPGKTFCYFAFHFRSKHESVTA